MVNKKLVIISIILSLATALIYAYDFFFMVGDKGVSGSDVQTQIGYIVFWHDHGELPAMCQVYPLYYYILRFIHHFISDWRTVTMIVTIGLSFTANLVQIAFVRLICREGSDIFAGLTGTALSFAWPISLQYGIFGGTTSWEMPLERVFLTSGATSPNHSLTYLCVKPFALIAVYLFIRMLDTEDRRFYGYTAAFAVTLFMSVLAKPNFYQAFAPAGVIAVFIYLAKKGFRVFPRCLCVAAAYLPATGWVLYGMTRKLNKYAVMPFEGIRLFGDETPLAIVIPRAIVFCIFVTAALLVFRQFEAIVGLGWLVYITGTLEFLLLFEPDDPLTLSMSWGFYIGQYVLFAVTICALPRLANALNGLKRYIVNGIGYVLLAAHACFGVMIFITTWWPWWKEYL